MLTPMRVPIRPSGVSLGVRRVAGGIEFSPGYQALFFLFFPPIVAPFGLLGVALLPTIIPEFLRALAGVGLLAGLLYRKQRLVLLDEGGADYYTLFAREPVHFSSDQLADSSTDQYALRLGGQRIFSMISRSTARWLEEILQLRAQQPEGPVELVEVHALSKDRRRNGGLALVVTGLFLGFMAWLQTMDALQTPLIYSLSRIEARQQTELGDSGVLVGPMLNLYNLGIPHRKGEAILYYSYPVVSNKSSLFHDFQQGRPLHPTPAQLKVWVYGSKESIRQAPRITQRLGVRGFDPDAGKVLREQGADPIVVFYDDTLDRQPKSPETLGYIYLAGIMVAIGASMVVGSRLRQD